jgi:hypothetical protein
MHDPTLIALSELHHIRLADAYLPLIAEPPRQDFTLHTIATKEALGQKTMLAELVIAGRETREKYPRAALYPVHFKKTYLPGALHRPTDEEFAAMSAACEILGYPPPIGYSPHTVRSCFISGRTLDRLTPLLLDPPEQNAEAARRAPELQLLGLWHALEQAFAALAKLHQTHFFHRDLELHNCTLCPSPARLFLIDFGASAHARPGEDTEKLRLKDLSEILKQAIYVQCGLGPQTGPLAEAALAHITALFKSPDYFLRRIDERRT